MRLTELTGAGGCSAKIAQTDLFAILEGLAAPAGADLLVGAATMDDAAIYRFSEDRWLVATVDFFPPPVDDPSDYGAIATANALSDVYAMGGRPLLLLNMVGFDLSQLDGNVLAAILRGGAQVAAEAGCLVAGGHSIRTPEPLFGCAVVGDVVPSQLTTNASAQPGDAVFLTKPLGTGVILNAHKQQAVEDRVLTAAVASMRTLNREAARAMVGAGASAATDVTGFGLLGHARNLALASGVRLRLRASALPALPGALDLIQRGYLPGGTKRNLELAQETTSIDADVPAELRALACDAQTSGGLIVTLSALREHEFLAQLPAAVRIGEVLASAPESFPLELV